MGDSNQEQIIVTRSSTDVAPTSAPSVRPRRLGRIALISVVVVLLAFVGKTGYEWYLSTVNCTPLQLVEKHWGFLDEQTMTQMAQTAGTFLLKNTQQPILVLSESQGLRENYADTAGAAILCKAPEPPLLCSFTGGACNRSTNGLTSAGAKFYVVAYRPESTPALVMNPERTILEQFTDNYTKREVQKLRVGVVAPMDIEGQALQALIPGGYGNTIEKDPLHFVSQKSGMYPTVIDFVHYATQDNMNAVMQNTDVVLIEEQLSVVEKVAWVRDLLQQGYVMYLYPAPEIYTYPIQK
jgi:hypothetical protein